MVGVDAVLGVGAPVTAVTVPGCPIRSDMLRFLNLPRRCSLTTRRTIDGWSKLLPYWIRAAGRAAAHIDGG
jgi:hypothetical protein